VALIKNNRPAGTSGNLKHSKFSRN